MFNNVLDRKKPFLAIKILVFPGLKNRIFSKGLAHAFGQKLLFFSLFVFPQSKTRNNVQ